MFTSRPRSGSAFGIPGKISLPRRPPTYLRPCKGEHPAKLSPGGGGQVLPRREQPGYTWGTLTDQARSEGWSHTPEFSPCPIFHFQKGEALATLMSASDGAGGWGSFVQGLACVPASLQCHRKPSCSLLLQQPSFISIWGQWRVSWKQVADHVGLGEGVSEK